MQAEITTLRERIVHQQAEQRRLEGVIATYERHISVAPTRESELAELTRDYETLRSVYASLLEKSEGAKIAANLETRQVGEQFKILDPARLPEVPFSPNRLMLNGIGAFAGLALGIGLVAFLAVPRYESSYAGGRRDDPAAARPRADPEDDDRNRTTGAAAAENRFLRCHGVDAGPGCGGRGGRVEVRYSRVNS